MLPLTVMQPSKEVRIMADAITARTAPTLPQIDIPKDCRLGKHGWVTFEIISSYGNVEVTALQRRIDCSGTYHALAAHGLLRAEWLPGMPGNNKVQQRVVFDKDGPRLIAGNLRGTRVPEEILTIQKVSRDRYAVVFPPTDAQQEFLEAFYKKADDERRAQLEEARRAEYKRAQKLRSPGEYRGDCLRTLEGVKMMVMAQIDSHNLIYDKESVARIHSAFGELRRALAEGGIVQRSAVRQVDGNVIYLTNERMI